MLSNFPSHLTLLFYPANLVGFLRLGLLTGAIVIALAPAGFLPLPYPALIVVLLIGGSGLMDLLDGYLARKYDHTSRFGALFDQGIDLLTHTVVWFLSGFALALPLLALEWAAGLAVSYYASRRSQRWKQVLTTADSRFSRAYFANNQRNLLSGYANVAHFLFPATLYLGPDFAWLAALTLPGLLLYELATVYILYLLRRAMLR